jgi:hypothetical protein
MGFLRRLFGGREPEEGDGAAAGAAGAAAAEPAGAAEPVTQQQLDEDERRYELDLARFEQARLDDLRQRQLRYADRSWTPEAQGGPERADDADRAGDGEGA